MEHTPLINAREVARQLNITPWTVYDLARRGLLPSIRIAPRCVRFDPFDVAQFIEEHRFPHSPPR